jgi:hypothetical protein
MFGCIDAFALRTIRPRLVSLNACEASQHAYALPIVVPFIEGYI